MRFRVAVVAVIAVAIGAVPRVLLASGDLPSSLRPFTWSDALFVYERGLRGHQLPYIDSTFEYPPLTALIAGIISLSTDVAAWFVASWAAVLAVCAGLTAWLLAGHGRATSTLRRFALAPQLLLLGSLNFDLLAVLFLVVALLAIDRRRDMTAAAAVGLGTASKLFPLAIAPIAIFRASDRVRAAFALALTLALLYVPAILAGRSAAASPAFYLAGIDANIDSPWGMLARVLGGLGVPSAQLVVNAITLTGLVATYLLVVWPRARAADGVAACGLAVATLLIWSRLYSPQYSLWLLPFFALRPLGGRLFTVLAVSDVAVFASISPLTLVRWSPTDLGGQILLALLVVGVLGRLAACVGVLRACARLAQRSDP